MISDQELTPIGHTAKPHGINGEISAVVDFDTPFEQLKCIILKIEGINVPFFIKSYRWKGSEAVLLTISGIDNQPQAAQLCGKTIYALTRDLPDDDTHTTPHDGFYISSLIGFTLTDQNFNTLGTITGFDDSTANTLLIIQTPSSAQTFVPIAPELVLGLDTETKSIQLTIPQGLLEL